MLLTIPDLLSAEQVSSVRELLDTADWVDGKVTAGPQSARARGISSCPRVLRPRKRSAT